MTATSPTYHDQPVLKEPVWIWSIPVYFYVGGVAGVAGTLGAAAQKAGRGDLENLVVQCRRLSAAGSMLGAVLLVIDLGRPERFLNMLRVFRPTSALSVGSWLLAAHGGASTAAVALGGRAAGFADAAGATAGVTGLPMSGYTGVLLGDTAIPLWHATRRSLPLLFVASAGAAAASALEVVDLSERERRVVRRFGLVAKVLEVAAMRMVERDAGALERVGRPLKNGLSGSMWSAARGAAVASAALSALPHGGRGRRWLSAALGTVASLGLRTALFHAGKVSSRDPRATFEQQRGRMTASAPSHR
jgi:hypothetical protein